MGGDMSNMDQNPSESVILDRIAAALAEWKRAPSITAPAKVEPWPELSEEAMAELDQEMRERDEIDELGCLVLAFRRACQADVEAISREQEEYGDDYEETYGFTMNDFALLMMKGELTEDFFGPFLTKVLGLPEDPWPGLTGPALKRMTRGRAREAKARQIDTRGLPGDAPLSTKLMAAKHRAWLEQSSS